ncbi:MAG: hypothetical protein CMM93_04275 [Rickettsiales bacterium]|nr:hypothetical protein [Rickettsiales bacterium]
MVKTWLKKDESNSLKNKNIRIIVDSLLHRDIPRSTSLYTTVKNLKLTEKKLNMLWRKLSISEINAFMRIYLAQRYPAINPVLIANSESDQSENFRGALYEIVRKSLNKHIDSQTQFVMDVTASPEAFRRFLTSRAELSATCWERNLASRVPRRCVHTMEVVGDIVVKEVEKKQEGDKVSYSSSQKECAVTLPICYSPIVFEVSREETEKEVTHTLKISFDENGEHVICIKKDKFFGRITEFKNSNNILEGRRPEQINRYLGMLAAIVCTFFESTRSCSDGFAFDVLSNSCYINYNPSLLDKITTSYSFERNDRTVMDIYCELNEKKDFYHYTDLYGAYFKSCHPAMSNFFIKDGFHYPGQIAIAIATMNCKCYYRHGLFRRHNPECPSAKYKLRRLDVARVFPSEIVDVLNSAEYKLLNQTRSAIFNGTLTPSQEHEFGLFSKRFARSFSDCVPATTRLVLFIETAQRIKRHYEYLSDNQESPIYLKLKEKYAALVAEKTLKRKDEEARTAIPPLTIGDCLTGIPALMLSDSDDDIPDSPKSEKSETFEEAFPPLTENPKKAKKKSVQRSVKKSDVKSDLPTQRPKKRSVKKSVVESKQEPAEGNSEAKKPKRVNRKSKASKSSAVESKQEPAERDNSEAKKPKKVRKSKASVQTSVKKSMPAAESKQEPAESPKKGTAKKGKKKRWFY